MKPLEEINLEYLSERPAAEKPQNPERKKNGMFHFMSNLLFYPVIVMVLFIAANSGNSGVPKGIMGYSYFNVLSSSMQNEIPKGSFILVKRTAPQALSIGDNITYMRDSQTSVTHKIIGIYENCENSGARGFQTKGTNNGNPDRDIVYEANVVGKVIFTVPVLGAVITYLGANIHIMLVIFGLSVLLSFSISGLFVKPVKDKGGGDDGRKKTKKALPSDIFGNDYGIFDCGDDSYGIRSFQQLFVHE